jgi:hypothetical protein
MLRTCIFLFLALTSIPAMAGVRATYDRAGSPPMVIEIADNGDIDARLENSLRFVVLGNRSYFVEDRLTGPVVMRLEDLASLLPSSSSPQAARVSPAWIVERGTAEVNGRTGRAYYSATATGAAAETPAVVIGNDPALVMLGPALNRVFAAEAVFGAIYWGWSPETTTGQDEVRVLFERGAPLSYGDLVLRTVEQVPIDAARFALPAEPESAEALRRRHAAEARRDEGRDSDDRMISRAVFASGRLWLLTDGGQLSSLAEGEPTRRIHDLGEPVLDICARGNVPVAVTGERYDGGGWTIRRWASGTWRTVRTIPRSFDALIALSCGADLEMALTSTRLIDLTGRARAVSLSEPLSPALVRAVVYVTPEAAWVGINRGEWGGGLRRIDRVTGAVATIARNASGELCAGPLNTDCDPVNGIATIPWRPRCVAAAIGLIHFEAHGRIASICPEGVEQMFVAGGLADSSNRREAGEAATGSFGSVAFFGLAANGDALIAAGHDGLYRIDASGAGTRRPWPRFVEVDGILVSFALPDVVLVMSTLNRRASMSGIAPLMAVR